MTPCNLNMKVWLIIVVSLGLIGAHAQTPQRKAVIGEVVSAGGKDLKIKTDQGATYTISTTDATSFVRIPPGEKDLKNASKIAFADINPGYLVLAQGPIADGATIVPATRVIVMTKADLAKKHERDREEWTTKGIAGTVDSVNPDTKEITVKIRGIVPKTVVVDASGNTTFRRYAPDSVKFSDAKPSTFADLHPGDMLRALGDKNADGSHIKAEEIVSGSFQTIAATVTSVDPATNTLVVKDLKTKQPVT